MVALKLQRIGRHKRPFFRIIAIDKKRDPQARAQEILGHFDPRNRKETLVLKQARIEYWLSKGAQPTGPVHNMLVDAGIIKSDKRSVTSLSKKKAAAKDKSSKEDAPKEEAADGEEKSEEPDKAPEETKPEEKKEDPSHSAEASQTLSTKGWDKPDGASKNKPKEESKEEVKE